MRAIISPSGSFIAIARPSLPARLDEAGDQSFGAELPQCNARQLVLAVEPARPARYLASIADPGLRRVARQFRELERRREALFHGFGLVARNCSEPGAPRRMLFAQPSPSIVLLD